MTENYEEENEFIDCARYGEFEEVQKMIKANINVNFQQPESGNTVNNNEIGVSNLKNNNCFNK